MYLLILLLIGVAVVHIKFLLQTEEGEVKVKPDRVIPQFHTFVIGIVICLVLAAIPAIVVSFVLSDISWMLGMPVFIFLLGINLVLIFKRGLVKLDINHHGVVIFFGKPRFGNWVLGEGLNFVPFFFAVMPVNMAEKVINIPPNKEDEGFTVTTLTDSEESQTGGKLVLVVRVGLNYKVSSSRQFISFENTSNPELLGEKLFEALRIKIIDDLRLIASALNDEDFIRGKNALSKSLLNGDINEFIRKAANAIPDDSVTPETMVKENINSVSIVRWGVEVLTLSIPKAETKSELSKEAREQVFREKNQRAAESIEGDHIRKQISLTAKLLRDEGEMGQKEAMEEATRVVMAQLGKVESHDIKGGGGDVTQAAALFSKTQKK